MYSANWKPTHQAKCRSYKAQSRAQLWRRQATEDPLHQVRDRWSHVPPKLYSSPSSLHNNPIGMPLHSSPGEKNSKHSSRRMSIEQPSGFICNVAELNLYQLQHYHHVLWELTRQNLFDKKKHEASSSISLSINVNTLQWWREGVSCNHHGELEAFI